MTVAGWKDCRVLVTGARGFIARHLCARLVERGAAVYGLSRQPFAGEHQRMQWLSADLATDDEARRLLERTQPDIVFHLAGHVTGSQGLSEVLPTFAANLVSTINLLTVAAERKNCRVVLAGSMQEPDGATAAPLPPSPYAASKWAATCYARMFHALYALPVVIARPMMVYGPGQWDRTKLLPYMITSLLRGVPPRLTSGARELDWVYVDDVVDGLLTIALAPGVEGRGVDLGSGELTNIRQLSEELVSVLGTSIRPTFGAVPDRPFEVPRVARVDETRALVAWSATTPLRDGLIKTIEWYRGDTAGARLAASDRTPGVVG